MIEDIRAEKKVFVTPMKPSDIVEHEKKYAKDKAALENKLDNANAER